jgi:hypothetical protein
MVTLELIERVTHRLQAGSTVTQVARELHIHRETVRKIRDKKHPLQKQPAQQRCKGCGGKHVAGVKLCLIARDRQELATVQFKRRHGGKLWNPYEKGKAA